MRDERPVAACWQICPASAGHANELSIVIAYSFIVRQLVGLAYRSFFPNSTPVIMQVDTFMSHIPGLTDIRVI